MEPVPVDLSGVPETLLWNLGRRAAAARAGASVLEDPLPVGVAGRLQYDFTNASRGARWHAVRVATFDAAVRLFLNQHSAGTVVALGEGLEIQFWRLDNGRMRWLSVDLPAALDLRRRVLPEGPRQASYAGSALGLGWLDQLDPAEPVLVTAQGLLPHFEQNQVHDLIAAIAERLPGWWFLRMRVASGTVTGREPRRAGMLAEFGGLSTPLVADACIRAGVPLRVAPPGIRAVVPGQRVAGRALPARHYGSVDVFLEAFAGAAAGDVLVVDNGGREDEACVGDLVVLEAQAAGVGGVMVWGLHRDTAELTQIGLPVFSYGCCPAGPVRLDGQELSALASAPFGACLVTRDDIVFGDDDGVLFVAASQAGEVLAVARQIGEVERDQAGKIQAGQTLRQQTAFSDYLARRAAEPSYTFRRHLRQLGGAIEE
jgi:4-hydroxy-4-methyl-2-oxoglutarate aldolase